MINKSAHLVGTVEFASTKLRNSIFIGYNRNSGEPIVWQKLQGQRSSRMTGRNIVHFVREMDETLAAGRARWLDDMDADTLERLRANAALIAEQPHQRHPYPPFMVTTT